MSPPQLAGLALSILTCACLILASGAGAVLIASIRRTARQEQRELPGPSGKV